MKENLKEQAESDKDKEKTRAEEKQLKHAAKLGARRSRKRDAKMHLNYPGFAGFPLVFLESFHSCLSVRCGNVLDRHEAGW